MKIKYKYKEDLKITIRNKKKASKEIDINYSDLTSILSGKKETTKKNAYIITTYIDNNANIKDYFDEIGGNNGNNNETI